MNVLLITDLYPQSSQHTTQFITWAVHELVKGLSKYDINVKKVIRPIREVHWKGMRKNKNILTRSFIDSINVETKSFFNLPRQGFYLRNSDISYLEESIEDIDLIITHMSLGASLANKLFKKYNINFIYIMHENDFQTLNRQSDIFKNATAIYTRSWALDIQLKEYDILSDGVVYSGIDKSLITFDCHHIGVNKKLKFISVNRLEKRKNIDVTLRALAKLPQQYDWEYTIIGEGTQKEYLNTLVVELGITKHVTFLGFQERYFCLEKMKESDIFIMPSNPETFGLAYLEAMASNCIIICAKGCGVDGLIENNFDGYTVEARNQNELKKLFIRLFEENQEKLLKNSHDTILHTTLDLAQENYANFIKNALNRTIK